MIDANNTIPGASSSSGGVLSRMIILNKNRKPAIPKTKPLIMPSLFFMIDSNSGFKMR